MWPRTHLHLHVRRSRGCGDSPSATESLAANSPGMILDFKRAVETFIETHDFWFYKSTVFDAIAAKLGTPVAALKRAHTTLSRKVGDINCIWW